jgi:hypothetical protein
MFKEYQHIERFNCTETQNIELGECYVFPKIDGTNASLWWDGGVQAGSRTRHLSIDSDNAGFFAWAQTQQKFIDYFKANPTHRLFGEWLVPHSLKTYRSEAWRNFYVFDVTVDKQPDEILHESDTTLKYIHYEEYKPLLEAYGISYIPPIAKITNGSYEQFINQLMQNVFLIEDGKGQGEGIVIKRYDFKNKYNRPCWTKIVTSEFKEKHSKEMGPPELKGEKMVEHEIAKEYVTAALVEKEYAKIALEGWSSKMIPRLLNTVYYSLVKEESWEFIKEHKNPQIDFKKLMHFTFAIVKERKPDIF